jgi:molecular chaperone GrpE
MSAAHHHHHHKPKTEDASEASKEPEVKDALSQEKAEAEKSEAPLRAPKMLTISDMELEALRKDLAEAKDKYLRVLAESENARKRLQKEKQEMTQYAIQNVIVDFLNPIDHMENALSYAQQMSDDVKHWAVGFQMILSQFKDVLSANGVAPFASQGLSFDPHRHEAVELVETTTMPPGMVLEECLKGYLMGDKTIIRPARVKVSKAPAEEVKNTEE